MTQHETSKYKKNRCLHLEHDRETEKTWHGIEIKAEYNENSTTQHETYEYIKKRCSRTSTTLIPTVGADDNQTLLKTTLLGSGLSNYDSGIDEGSVHMNVNLDISERDSNISKNADLSEISGKVWQEADFSIKPNIKYEDTYDSKTDGKRISISTTSTCDTLQEKNEFQTKETSLISLNYSKESLVYKCQEKVSFGNECVSINETDVSSGNIQYNDVISYQGNNPAEVPNDDCFDSENMTILHEKEIKKSDQQNPVVVDFLKKYETYPSQMREEDTKTKKKSLFGKLVDTNYLKKVVKVTIEKILAEKCNRLIYKPRYGRRPITRRNRRDVRRVLRRTIRHDGTPFLPIQVNKCVFPVSNERMTNVDFSENEMPAITTQNGDVAGLVLQTTASLCSMGNYFNKVLMGYNFSLNEKMAYELLRVESFKNLPVSCQVTPLRMAKTGFFKSGDGDEVTCFSCGKQYKNWRNAEVPNEIHRIISPNCR